MKNYNYSIHNDLISNFLFLASCIGNYEVGNLETPRYSIYKKTHTIEKDKLFVLDESIEDKDVYPDLEKIYNILKMRFNGSDNLFENNEKLLLSRFFNWNWRLYIKQELDSRIKEGSDFEILKNSIVSSLSELEYRLGLAFTWDLSSSIENKWYQTRNRGFYPSNHEHNNILESIGILDQIDGREEDNFPLQINGIQNDIDWVKHLNKDDIKFVFIELHPDASKKELIKTVIRLLKEKRYFNNEYSEKYKCEIEKLFQYLFGPSYDINFDLSFINKSKQINFIKFFLYCQYEGYISSYKKDIVSIFSSIFNRGKRDLEDLNKKIISEEIKANKGIASYVNDLLLLRFTK